MIKVSTIHIFNIICNMSKPVLIYMYALLLLQPPPPNHEVQQNNPHKGSFVYINVTR